MAYKKTWLSYVIWAVFTCITGVMLANYTILFWTKEIDSKVGFGTVALVLGVFAIVVGVYLLLRKAILPMIQKFSTNEKITGLLEGIVVVIAFGGGLAYRIYLCMQTGTETIAETMYYHQAMVKAGEMVEPMIHGASYLYTLCLSLVLSFLGNKVIAGVWFQIVLQMVTLVLAYCVVRKMVGRVAACVAMIMLAVSSVYVNQIFVLTPENFYFVLYLLGMLVVGSFVRGYTNNRYNKAVAVISAIFAGIVIGCLMYLDAIAVSIVILLAGILSGVRRLKEGETFPKISFSILIFGVSIIAACLSLLIMFVIDAGLSNGTFLAVAEAWISLYRAYLPMGYILYQTEFSIIECLIQVMFAALLIMSFWNHSKEQNCTPFICFMLLLAPTPLAIVGVLSYQVFSIFIWSVLAGIGLQQCFVVEGVQKVTAETIETEEAAETVEATETVEVSEPAEGAAEEAVETAEAPSEEVQEQPVQPELPAKPRFIENPLPLPKKHEKKEMDYQYEVTEDKMKFDVEIKENDDFDIK